MKFSGQRWTASNLLSLKLLITGVQQLKSRFEVRKKGNFTSDLDLLATFMEPGPMGAAPSTSGLQVNSKNETAMHNRTKEPENFFMAEMIRAKSCQVFCRACVLYKNTCKHALYTCIMNGLSS